MERGQTTAFTNSLSFLHPTHWTFRTICCLFPVNDQPFLLLHPPTPILVAVAVVCLPGRLHRRRNKKTGQWIDIFLSFKLFGHHFLPICAIPAAARNVGQERTIGSEKLLAMGLISNPNVSERFSMAQQKCWKWFHLALLHVNKCATQELSCCCCHWWCSSAAAAPLSTCLHFCRITSDTMASDFWLRNAEHEFETIGLLSVPNTWFVDALYPAGATVFGNDWIGGGRLLNLSAGAFYQQPLNGRRFLQHFRWHSFAPLLLLCLKQFQLNFMQSVDYDFEILWIAGGFVLSTHIQQGSQPEQQLKSIPANVPESAAADYDVAAHVKN